MSDEREPYEREADEAATGAGSALLSEAETHAPGAWTERLCVALLFAIVAFMAYRIPAMQKADPDMFWHLATGRWIVAHRAIPVTDVFSWWGVQHGSAWLVQEWLSEIVYWAVYALGGFTLLYAFTALLAASAVTLTYALSRVRAVPPFAATLVSLAAGIGLMRFVSPRPQMFTFCLVLVLCICLERGWVWAAPAIVLLGANLHGGTWPLYLAIVAFYALPKRWPVLAASALAVALNPAGLALVALPFRTLLHPTAPAVVEFQRTAIAASPIDLVAYLGVAALLAVASRRPGARDGLLALAVTALSLTALRHVAFYYLLVLPLLAPYFTPAAAEERAGAGLRQTTVLAIGLAAAAAAVVFVTVTAPPLSVDRGYPSSALAYIRNSRLTNVMNVLQDGGYMTFNGSQPMVDGRGDPFVGSSNGGRDLWNDYVAVMRLDGDWPAFVRREQVRWILVGKTMGFYRVLQHSTLATVAYEDAGYGVFSVEPR